MVREDNIQDKQSMVPGEEPRGVGRPRDPDEIRSMKQDIHRKIGLANKRIDRLNEQGLNNAPALRNLKETTGKERFSIKGYKSKNELRRLESQLDTFINQKTSTVTGVKKWQRNIADTLGINYTKVSEIGDSLDNFIELLNKLTQYQRSQGGIEEGSERRVTAIDKYIRDNDIELSQINPDDLIEAVDKMMKEEEDSYNQYLQDWESEWFGEEG